MSFTYLASNYTHPDSAVREYRFQAVCRVAADLMLRGEVIFSPIAHSHPIAEARPGDWGVDHEFWKRQDAPYVEACSKMYVLRLDGWEKSRGVAHEIERARERGIPVEFIDP